MTKRRKVVSIQSLVKSGALIRSEDGSEVRASDFFVPAKPAVAATPLAPDFLEAMTATISGAVTEALTGIGDKLKEAMEKPKDDQSARLIQATVELAVTQVLAAISESAKSPSAPIEIKLDAEGLGLKPGRDWTELTITPKGGDRSKDQAETYVLRVTE